VRRDEVRGDEIGTTTQEEVKRSRVQWLTGALDEEIVKVEARRVAARGRAVLRLHTHIPVGGRVGWDERRPDERRWHERRWDESKSSEVNVHAGLVAPFVLEVDKVLR
jgi:hypothetical protein